MLFDQLKRREFITLLGGAAVAWPLAASAQQSALPVIGFLGAATASAWSNWSAAFVQRLRELGWSEGRTVSIEYRWAEGRYERAAEIAAEFVRLKVDVILTGGGVLLAAKQATSTIPIVFAVANDPVGAGFVSSLARPGGNITGLSLQTTDLAAKRLGLQADALDFLGDAGNYAISLFVVGMALRYRALAALVKGSTMAVFGLWVLGITGWHAWHGTLPHALTMGAVGFTALAANAASANIAGRPSLTQHGS